MRNPAPATPPVPVITTLVPDTVTILMLGRGVDGMIVTLAGALAYTPLYTLKLKASVPLALTAGV